MEIKAFDGKVVIITGGSSGIGAASALEFARQDAKVVIAARRADNSQAIMCQIEELDWDAAMLRHGNGAIVNVSCIYGYKPSDVAHAPYCAGLQ